MAEFSSEFRVQISPDGVDEAERCHQELAAAGVHLPLHHRAPWLKALPSSRHWFVSASRGDRCRYGFVVEGLPVSSLFGHRVLRVRRLRPAADRQAMVAALEAVRALASEQPRVLRLNVELFGPDAAGRDFLARALADLGFVRAPHPLSYRNTLVIDLTMSEEELLASFHATARRHIRAVGKRPVEVRLVTDPDYGGRMGALVQEAFGRTAGRSLDGNWRRWIELGQTDPDLVRIVGMFSTEKAGPEGLWAFAIGYHHGDHVEYGVAASTRETGKVRLPMGYALAWDLMQWAKATGAQWFDFGGITEGSHGDDDPLGGISDFKRYFSKNSITVGDEWVYEPRPLRAALTRVIRDGRREVLRWARLGRPAGDGGA